jgi:DNA-binding LacI/PurR family transcriptional regulator
MFVSGMDEQRVSPIVTIDNHQIGRLSWWEARQHLEGWDVELRAHGLNANNQIVVEGDWNAESGERGLYRLLDPAHSSWK